VCLTGHGWYDGTGKTASGASTGKQLQYIAFGAAVCEVRCVHSEAEGLRKQLAYLFTTPPRCMSKASSSRINGKGEKEP